MNFFTLPIVDGSVLLGDWRIAVSRRIAAAAAEVIVGIRPEHFEIGSGADVEVDVVEELGADAYLYGRIVSADGVTADPVIARIDWRDPPQRGARLRLHPQPGRVHFFAADGLRLE
jgi:multiple sugar transport system ATP-binding protein